MKRKLENSNAPTLPETPIEAKTEENFLSLMPKELLETIATCDSDEPLKLLVIISSLSKKFYETSLLS